MKAGTSLFIEQFKNLSAIRNASADECFPFSLSGQDMVCELGGVPSVLPIQTQCFRQVPGHNRRIQRLHRHLQ